MSDESQFAARLRAVLKERSKGEVETWGFVAAFMEMIDEVERELNQKKEGSMSEDTEQIAIKVAGEFRLFCAREGITLPHHAEVRLKSLWATSIRSALACERELNQKGGDAPERSSHSGSVEKWQLVNHRLAAGGQNFCDLAIGNNVIVQDLNSDEASVLLQRRQAELRQSIPPVEAWRDLDEVRPTEADGDEHGRVLCRWSDEEIRAWPVTHFTKNEPTRVTHWMPLPKFGRVERKT